MCLYNNNIHGLYANQNIVPTGLCSNYLSNILPKCRADGTTAISAPLGAKFW